MNIKDFLKKNYIVIWVFFLISISIFIITESYMLGFNLTGDSINYLRASEAIKLGYGFFWNRASGFEDYYATWPIGYPFLIAIISMIFNLEIYLASKITQIFILIFFSGLLVYSFGYKSVYLIFIFLNVGFLEIIVFTWSELLFIFLLTGFSLFTYKMYSNSKFSILETIFATFFSMAAFLTRYIGAMTLIILIVMLMLAIIRKQNYNFFIIKIIQFIIPIIVTGSLMFIYLRLNQINTGFITGTERVARDEGLIELTIVLAIALFDELSNAIFFLPKNYSYSVIFIIIVALIFKSKLLITQLKKYISNTIRLKFIELDMFMILVGAIYYSSLIFLRYTSDFDPFNNRLMFPGTFFILFGFILNISHTIDKTNIPFRISNIIALSSYILIIFISLNTSNIRDLGEQFYIYGGIPISYVDERQRIEEKFNTIPSESIMITQDHLVKFIRPDLFVNTGRNIDIDDFTKEYNNKKIYVDISIYPDERYYSEYKNNLLSLYENNEEIFVVFD